MSQLCNNTDNLDQNNIEQVENAVCSVLNGIDNTYYRQNFQGRPKFALFCSYCCSRGHAKDRGFKRPQKETQQKPREKSFYGHMRNHKNLTNIQIS